MIKVFAVVFACYTPGYIECGQFPAVEFSGNIDNMKDCREELPAIIKFYEGERDRLKKIGELKVPVAILGSCKYRIGL